MSQTLHHLNQFLLALPITGCGGGSQCIFIHIHVYIRHICNLFCNLEKKKKTPQQFRKPAVSLSAWLSLLSPCRCSAEPASSCQGGQPTGQRWEWWRPRCPRARCPSDRLLLNHTGRHSSAQGSTEGFAVNRKRFHLFCPASNHLSWMSIIQPSKTEFVLVNSGLKICNFEWL